VVSGQNGQVGMNTQRKLFNRFNLITSLDQNFPDNTFGSGFVASLSAARKRPLKDFISLYFFFYCSFNNQNFAFIVEDDSEVDKIFTFLDRFFHP